MGVLNCDSAAAIVTDDVPALNAMPEPQLFYLGRDLGEVGRPVPHEGSSAGARQVDDEAPEVMCQVVHDVVPYATVRRHTVDKKDRFALAARLTSHRSLPRAVRLLDP